MAHDSDSKVTFKILEARLLIRHITTSDAILYAHNNTLEAGALAKYHLTRFEIETFTFAAVSQSLSIGNAVLGPLSKHILCTSVKNSDFPGTLDSNPYNFRHYGIREFELYVNGGQNPSEGMCIDTGRDRTTVLGYRTLFEASGIRHSKAGLQITHDIFIGG
jgi:hypothetical protein